MLSQKIKIIYLHGLTSHFCISFSCSINQKRGNFSHLGLNPSCSTTLIFSSWSETIYSSCTKRKKAGREGANKGGEHNTLYKAFSLSIISLMLYGAHVHPYSVSFTFCSYIKKINNQCKITICNSALHLQHSFTHTLPLLILHALFLYVVARGQ